MTPTTPTDRLKVGIVGAGAIPPEPTMATRSGSRMGEAASASPGLFEGRGPVVIPRFRGEWLVAGPGRPAA